MRTVKKKQNIPEKCVNCRHWERITTKEEGDEMGQCRRYPPIVSVTADGHIVCAWPSTELIDWCGEFEVRHDA